jgi:hypothetical protein
MARSWGKIRKLPSGRYQASYVGPDGARHAGPITFGAKIDAEGWLSDERRLLLLRLRWTQIGLAASGMLRRRPSAQY